MKERKQSASEFKSDLGELLVSARKKYGYNKKQMAKLFGFDEATYGRLELRTNPKVNTRDIKKLKLMAPYLGVPYSELLAAAGISSEMKKEVLYDFDGSEIDYDSAIKFIYKADPKLFSYAKGISKMPVDKIRLLEKMIEMLLDEEVEKDLSKKLIATNIENSLELYGMSEHSARHKE